MTINLNKLSSQALQGTEQIPIAVPTSHPTGEEQDHECSIDPPPRDAELVVNRGKTAAEQYLSEEYANLLNQLDNDIDDYLSDISFYEGLNDVVMRDYYSIEQGIEAINQYLINNLKEFVDSKTSLFLDTATDAIGNKTKNAYFYSSFEKKILHFGPIDIAMKAANRSDQVFAYERYDFISEDFGSLPFILEVSELVSIESGDSRESGSKKIYVDASYPCQNSEELGDANGQVNYTGLRYPGGKIEYIALITYNGIPSRPVNEVIYFEKIKKYYKATDKWQF